MDVKDRLAHRLLDARQRTEELLAPVDDARLSRQHDQLMSPLVWDYGHIAVYEELWLVHRLAGLEPADPQRQHLYDAFENPRRVRGDLPLMSRTEVASYRREVDDRALELLAEAEVGGDDPLVRGAFVYEMILQHEHQHQETILQALQMLPGGYRTPDLSGEDGRRSGIEIAAPAGAPDLSADGAMVRVAAGLYPIGRETGAPYDNESPRHRVELAAYDIDRFPVSNRRFLDFIDDGGYARPELWHADGWSWRQQAGVEGPKHWERTAGGWTTERFGMREPVDPFLPVMHVCWYEADAFARWAGGRLPTEFEWEVAATWDPATGIARAYPWGDEYPDRRRATLGQRAFRCSPIGSLPASASAAGCEQMIGDVWEWTSSPFLPYPGFAAFPYREYSEVFFGSDYRVLRGGSWATRSSVARPTFRNWDFPIRRQLFAGFRCARDVPAS